MELVGAILLAYSSDSYLMPAYTKSTIVEFIRSSPSELVGLLQQAYAADGFCSQYTRQTIAWARVIPDLQLSAEISQFWWLRVRLAPRD